jgi:hypothetical protein
LGGRVALVPIAVARQADHTRPMARFRLLRAAGGAVFAVVTLTAFLISPGPSSAGGATVVAYYTAHGDAAIWQAVLVGFGVFCFVWFAGAFAEAMPSANAVLVSAGAMAAVYLVTLGAWESLGETYNGMDFIDVQSYGDAHALFDVGVGASHMASFADAAFVGATTVGLLTSVRPWRRLGAIGIVLTVAWLINAPLQILADQRTMSGWSVTVGTILFLALLAWVFALSVILVITLRRTPPATPAKVAEP